MSEKKYPEKKSNTAPLVATVIVGLAAVAAVVMLLIMNNDTADPGGSSGLPSGTQVSFRPTQELVDECSVESHDLLQESYKIIRLFVTEGLPHEDEPYGNEPEDGIYTVNSKDYTSFEQIEALVKSVYIDSEAERILHNLDGNGLEVYKKREILVDAVYSDEASDSEASGTGETAETGETGETSSTNRPAYVKKTVLGINADFKPDESYKKAWETSRFVFDLKSESECALTIYLGADESTDLSAVDPGSILETSMRKQDGKWRLTKFVY